MSFCLFFSIEHHLQTAKFLDLISMFKAVLYSYVPDTRGREAHFQDFAYVLVLKGVGLS